jgi:hypothetical protein
VATFKAVELDRTSRKPTGRAESFEADGRAAAVAHLLDGLGVAPATARVDPSRTLVDTGAALWTIVQLTRPSSVEPPALRRAAAKHRHVP